jgi:hypothetical protein
VLFRFPPTKQSMPSGQSWGIFSKRGTYQQANSASALLCSSRSISGCTSVSSMKSSSVLTSVVLLLAFNVLLESHVTYPTPLVILSNFSFLNFVASICSLLYIYCYTCAPIGSKRPSEPRARSVLTPSLVLFLSWGKRLDSCLFALLHLHRECFIDVQG